MPITKQFDLFYFFPILSFFTASFVALNSNALFDNDIYFLIASGREILSDGLTTIEPLTLHENFNYLTQQWLSSVIDAVLFDSFGKQGIVIFYIALWALTFVLFFFNSLRISNNRKLSLLATALLIIGLTPFIKCNPRIFDVLALLLACYTCYKFVVSTKSYYLIILPLVEILLVNFHCSMWPVPIFAPVCFLFTYPFNRKRNLTLLIAILFTTLSALINPYGIDGLAYIVLSLFSPSFRDFNISELQSFSLDSFGVLFFYLLFLVGLYLYKRSSIRIKPTPLELLALLLLLGTFISIRIGILFFPVFCLSIVDTFKTKDFSIKNEHVLRVCKGFCIGLCIVAIYLSITSIETLQKLSITQNEIQREEAITKLEDAGLQDGAKIYNDFGDGGYLEFRGYKPYIDERAELFCIEINKTKDIASEWIAVKETKKPLSEILCAYPFDAVVINKQLEESYNTVNQISNSGFKIIYENDYYLCALKA